MIESDMLTQSKLQERLNYDPETGILTWKVRPVDTFSAGPSQTAKRKCVAWNNKYAGKRAATSVGNHGYYSIRMDRVRYLAHRVIWLLVHGRWPSEQIDHANGNRLDNRMSNLREASNGQNAANRPHTHPGLKGARRRPSGRWHAQISVNNRQIHLGVYDTAQEAHDAYVAAAEKYFGNFARAA